MTHPTSCLESFWTTWHQLRFHDFSCEVNNPYYWSGIEIWPMSIAMGITEQQRSAVRKLVEEAFAAPSNTGLGEFVGT